MKNRVESHAHYSHAVCWADRLRLCSWQCGIWDAWPSACWIKTNRRRPWCWLTARWVPWKGLSRRRPRLVASASVFPFHRPPAWCRLSSTSACEPKICSPSSTKPWNTWASFYPPYNVDFLRIFPSTDVWWLLTYIGASLRWVNVKDGVDKRCH